MSTITQELQVLYQTDGLVELHILDLTSLGGTIYYFSPSVYSNNTPIVWNGNAYTHIPISSAGWTLTSGGTLPQPTITVSNVNKILLQSVVTLGDIVGATYTRYRTFEKYLDGGSQPDTSQIIGPDVYTVVQKTAHNKNQISWLLASPLDKPFMKLPGRQCLKNDTVNNTGFPGIGRYQR